MQYIRKADNASRGSGTVSFALCSLFLILGAAAGCYSGSHVAAALPSLAEKGRSFGQCLALNLTAVGAVLLLGSSCVGFILLPLLNGAAGFLCGFVMAAATLVEGGWGKAFAQCGWLIVIALPMFSVLCVCAARASAASCRTILLGARTDGEALSGFIKTLMISGALAVLLALAASAV